MKKKQSELMNQFRKWAKSLMKVNSEYVIDPGRLIPYIKGPNWDDLDIEYAHYRETVSFYGDELLEAFEELRSLPTREAEAKYLALLDMSGVVKRK